MGEEANLAVIQRTQETLGKYIKKPPLTEKLLRKPPFRFLHDVMKEVINTTGFMKDTFTEDELNIENIKDRDAKVAFLQKAIDHVVLVTGETLKIRPNKTVAGHEADRTNEFLQALSKAIELHGTSLQSTAVEGKPSSTHSTIKSEKKGSHEQRKTEEKSQRHSKNESPKAVSGTKSSEKKTEKKEKSRRSLTEQDNMKLQNGEAIKKSSTKTTSSKGESNDNLRNTSKDRSHHKTKSKSQKLEDINSKKDHRERKETAHIDKEHKRLKEKISRDKDTKEKRNNKVERGSKENSKTKELKKVDSNKSSPPKLNIRDSPKHSAERRRDDIIDGSMSHDSKDVEAKGLGTKEIINEKLQLQESPKTSPPRRPPTARILSGRPLTARLTSSQLTNGGTTIPSLKDQNLEDVTKEAPIQASSDGQIGTQGHETTRPLTSTIRRSSARPPTARPAAPRVKVVDTAPEEHLSSDSPNQVANIIVDGDVKDDDDDDDNNNDDLSSHMLDNELFNNSSDVYTDGKPHGSLVTQILETKKDLENGSQRPGTGFKSVEMDKSLLADSTRKKGRELFAREIEKLKGNVQMLTRSANPLGKLIDYLQEDIDSMLRELDMWHVERKKNENALHAEESKADNGMEKLYNQLQETEDLIQNEIAKISTLKANIIRNDERIQKMIVATQL